MTAHPKLPTTQPHKKRTAKPTTPDNTKQPRDNKPLLAVTAPDLSDWEVELVAGHGRPSLPPLHSLAKRPGG